MRHYDYIISQSEPYVKLIRKKCILLTKNSQLSGHEQNMLGWHLTINAKGYIIKQHNQW